MARKPEDLSGKIYGDLEIIGDTGKRSKHGGSQIVIARNIKTGELFEGIAENFKNGTTTGYIGSYKHIAHTKNLSKNEAILQKSAKKLYINGTRVNSFNNNPNSNSKSGYKGITFDNKYNRWRTSININKEKSEKTFIDFKDAVIYLNDFRIKHLNPLMPEGYKKYRKIDKTEIKMNEYVIEKQKQITEFNKNKEKLIYEKKKKQKGYNWNKAKQKWTARIMVDRKQKHLGHFENEQDAINARKEAVEKYFNQKGDF